MDGEANMDYFEVPAEDNLARFFGSEAVERSIDDGYWCYEVVDERGMKVRFSFKLYERSVQTVILFSIVH